jgi:hypothetical protein
MREAAVSACGSCPYVGEADSEDSRCPECGGLLVIVQLVETGTPG